MSRIYPVLLALPVLVASKFAMAEEKVYSINIDAQPLSAALESLAKQTGVKPFLVNEVAQGKRVGAFSGQYRVKEALDRLLLGSGLSYTFTAEDAVVIKSNQPLDNTLSAVTVTDKYQQDAAGYIQVNSISATKTDTPIKQTPQSIQVIKRSLIDDQQSLNVSESLKNVSGVVTNTSVLSPTFDQTRIRGFKAEQLVDGFTQYYNPGDRESTVNIDSIEVLKGTNGILYSGGSGSPVGGVVNINSKLPKAYDFVEAGFKIGTYSYYQPYVDLNKVLNKNALFRFTGEYTNAGNYVHNIDTQRYNLNPSLTLTNHDSTSLTLQGKISRWTQPDYQGLPANGSITGNFRIPKTTFVGSDTTPNSKSQFNSATALFDHKFNQTWSVNLKARYSQSDFDQNIQSLVGLDSVVADKPFMAPSTWGLMNTRLFQDQQERSFQGNLQAKFDYGVTKNTWLIGADHSDFRDKGFMGWDMNSLADLSKGYIDLANPASSSKLPWSNPGAGINNQFVDNTTYGGYTQLQTTVYDRLHMLASVRIAHVGIDFLSTDPMAPRTASASETKPLPRIGAVYDLTDQFSLFINYNEGMRGQPYANFVGKAQPEQSTTLEGGVKFDINKQLVGQLAGYQIDRSHVAVTDYTSPIFAAKAAGQQRARGIETDLTWQPLANISILANYAYTDAKFTDNLAGVAKGNQLALVPSNSGRLWVNYKFPQAALKGFSVGAGIYAQGEAYLSDNNQFKTPGFHSFDTTVSYEHKQYKLAASIKNLTDENYYQPYGYLGGRVLPAEGTTAYVTGSVRY